jgi:hypothetical protein
MATVTLSLTEAARLNLQNLGITSGLPPLPHIPESLDILLTPEQQEANLLHVALWVVERDQANFYMANWHNAWESISIRLHIEDKPITGEEAFNDCGAVHCIAGFSQVMAGEVGFSKEPWEAGSLLLGEEANGHFSDSNEKGLDFLKEVIARNS